MLPSAKAPEEFGSHETLYRLGRGGTPTFLYCGALNGQSTSRASSSCMKTPMSPSPTRTSSLPVVSFISKPSPRPSTPAKAPLSAKAKTLTLLYGSAKVAPPPTHHQPISSGCLAFTSIITAIYRGLTTSQAAPITFPMPSCATSIYHGPKSSHRFPPFFHSNVGIRFVPHRWPLFM